MPAKNTVDILLKVRSGVASTGIIAVIRLENPDINNARHNLFLSEYFPPKIGIK